MGARSSFLFAVLLLTFGKSASGLEIGQFDLHNELGNAKFVSESRVVQATCIKTRKAPCARLLYKLVVNRGYVGVTKKEYTLITSAVLITGATYLHYVVDRELESEKLKADVLIQISSQPVFSGSKWSSRDWIMLPDDLTGERFGAVKLQTDSCFVGGGKGRGAVRLCSFGSVVEYDRIKAFLMKRG